MQLQRWLLAVSIAWTHAAGAYQIQLASAGHRLFLEIQSVAKSGIAEAESVVSQGISTASKSAIMAKMRDFNDHHGIPHQNVQTISAVDARQSVVDTSWGNNLVILPCLVVGGPLFWIWYHLEDVRKSDEIFTATDADLREIEISRVGASGVALLRRQCDRHTGIMFAFAGIMLQTVFLYYMAVASCRKIYEEVTQDVSPSPTPVPLLFCSLFCNTLVCCASLILGMKCLTTTAPQGYEELHRVLVYLDSFVIPLVSAAVGALLLCSSRGIASLVFNSTAMAFVCSINMQIAGLMSWSLSGHGGRAFQPANVSIKDSENSTQYAHYSFIASAVVASVTVPVGILTGVV